MNNKTFLQIAATLVYLFLRKGNAFAVIRSAGSLLSPRSIPRQSILLNVRKRGGVNDHNAAPSKEQQPRARPPSYEHSRHHSGTGQSSSPTDFATYIHDVSAQGDFTYYLKSAAQRKLSLSASDRQSLAKELLSRLPDFSLSNVANILWSLGTLKLPIRSKDMLAVSDMIIERLDSSRDSLTSGDISMSLLGLARLGLNFHHNNNNNNNNVGKKDTRDADSFLEALPRTMNLMDDQQVANVVWSMGKIGVHWESLSVRIQTAVAGAIVRTIPKMTPLGVANSLHGLSNQRAKWDSLPANLKDALYAGLERTIGQMKEQEVSNCMSGLGRLGAEWVDLSPHIRSLLETAFLRTLDERNLCSKGVAMSVHGLGRMNADFPSLPANFRSSIMSAIHRIAPTVNAQEVANILYGLGKMGTLISVSEAEKVASDGEFGCKLADDALEEVDNCHVGSNGNNGANSELFALGMTRKARVSILDALSREAWQMTAQGISNSCWGLMLMGALWDEDLTVAARDAIFTAVTREAVRMDEQEVGNTVYALGRMGVHWSEAGMSADVRHELLAAVEDKSEHMAPAGVVMTLLGFGRMHLSWQSMPTGVRAALTRAGCRVLRVASDRTVSSLVHALAAVGAHWEQMGAGLQTAVRESIARSHSEVQRRHLEEASSSSSSHHEKNKEEERIIAAAAAIGQQHSQANILLPASGSLFPPLSAPPASESTLTPAVSISSTVASSVTGSISESDNESEDSVIDRRPRVSHRVRVSVSALSSSSSSSSSSSVKPDAVVQRAAPVSMSSLLMMKSSRVAAEVLLSSQPLPPSELAAIQSMFSPPSVQTKQQLLNQLLTTAEAVAAAESSKSGTAGSSVVVADTDSMMTSKEEDLNPVPVMGALSPLNLVPVTEALSLPVDRITTANASSSLVVSPSSSPPSLKILPRVVATVPAASKNKQQQQQPKSKKRREDLFVEIGIVVTGKEDHHRHPRDRDHRVVPLHSCAHGNHLVYSLGQMGASWDKLGSSTRTTLCNSLLESLPAMDEHAVVTSLHGLTCLGAKWRDLRADVRLQLTDAIQRVSPDMGEQGVAVAYLSLAKLEVCWTDDLSEPVKMALRQAISQQAHIGEHALSSLLYGLGKLSRKWDDLHPSVRQTLKEAIVVCHLNDRCTPQGVANSLYGLAQMQTSWSQLSSSVRRALILEAKKAAPSATETQLSNIISSLSKMGVTWDTLSADARALFQEQLIRRTRSMNEQHLSNMLFSLGTMGLNWQGLSDTLRAAFVSGLKRVNNNRANKKSEAVMIADELLPVVEYIMQHSGSSGDTDSNELPVAPSITAKKHHSSGRSHGRSEGRDFTANSNSNSNSSKQQEQQSRKAASSKQMNAQGVSMTIVGLSRLGAGWSLLPEDLVRTLESAVVETSADMNFAQVAATVSGLSKSQWRWQSLSPSTQAALMASITRTAPKATPLDIAILLNGMGVLGMRWSDLPHDARRSVMQGVCLVARGGDAHEIAGVVFGLGLMECTWEKMAQKVRKVLAEGVLRVTGSPDAAAATATVPRNSLLHAKNAADASWLINGDNPLQKTRIRSRYVVTSPVSVSPASRPISSSSTGATPVNAATATAATATATNNMSPQAAANLAYGISLLVFDNTESSIQNELNPVHEALLSCIFRIGASTFSEPEREQVLIYMHVLHTVVALDAEAVNSHPGCMLRADKRHTKPSKLQQSVVSSLTSALRRRSTAELQVENEYSAFDGAFPVDATIFEGDRPVAFVEVDGPQHYRKDGELLRKDLMKEALYRRKHPNAAFTRVRFDQVNRLGSKYVGAQVANYVATVCTVRGVCCHSELKETSSKSALSPPHIHHSHSTSSWRINQHIGHSSSHGQVGDAASAICALCEEEGLAARRAERELAMALAGREVRGSAYNDFWDTRLPLQVASEPDNS